MAQSRARAAAPEQDLDQGVPARAQGGLQSPGAGNQLVQELVKGAGDTGYKGNLAAFEARMEQSFRISLSGVNLVGGDRGEKEVGPGAVATTRNDSIFVGGRFAAMGLTEQEEVLAHEIGHVAQAQGTGGIAPAGEPGGGGGGDPEGDADRMAATALEGGEARPETAVQPGESHDWSIGETIGGAVDSVAGWAADRIASAADLVAFIAQAGEAAARPVIDWLATHKVEILVGFLTLNPANALAVYVIRKLPTERITQWMQSVDAKTAAKVVAAVIAAGAIAVIAPALFALGPLAGPIIKELGGPTIALLWQHAPQQMRDLAKQKLIQGWPTGLGLALDGSIGATFGYPVYLGGEAFFEVSHFSEGVFKLRRGGMLVEALDTGVGAGGYVGLGGGKKGGGQGEGGLGIGAQAGAEAQAGLKQFVLQEFEFPVSDDNAFGAFMIALLQADTSASMSVLSLFSTQLRRVNPVSYNTMTKFEFKAFAQGNAGAFAGLRTAGEGTRQGGSTWRQNEGARDTGQRKWWQTWLTASVFGRIAGEAGVGLETRNKDFTTDRDGVRVPSKMEVDAYGEATAALAIVHAVPIISQSLPQLPSFDGGGGIKVTWTLTGGVDDTEPQVSAPTWKLYAKTGNLDRYQGSASETTIALSNLNAQTFSSLETFLASIQAGTEFKRRFSLGAQLGRKYFGIARNQGALNVMLPQEYRAYGFRIEGYLDLEAEITANTLRTIFRSIAAISSAYTQGGAPLQQLYMDVMTFISTGRGPQHVMGQLETIANAILAGVKKLQLHGLVGLSVAGGGQLSAGAKVRVHGNAGAQLTMDHDLLSSVKGQITVAEIQQLIRGVGEGTGTIQVDGDRS